MTYPIQHNSYSIATGSSPSTSPIFIPRDPGTNDVSYPVQQRWINTLTQAIWVLESFSSAGGVVRATWRAIAPIVLSTADPTSADYLYPLGQTWLNTSLTKYWVLVAVSGTIATWDELTAATSGSVLSFTMSTGTSPVSPDGSGNINLPNGNNITPTGGTNAITYNLTGTTNHAVQIGNASGSLTSIAVGTSGQLLQSAGAADPNWTTATYPTAAGTSGNVIISNGTNFVSSSISIDYVAPTIQQFTSGSGTYSRPTSPTPLYIRVEMVGPGGGGAGSGTSGAGNGVAGSAATTFGTALLSAGAGSGGTAGQNPGGSGGSASLGSGPIGIALSGATGGGWSSNVTMSSANPIGGWGGNSAYGGGGTSIANAAGSDGTANTGAGGGGGGADSIAVNNSGSGGGSGAYVNAIITSPASTYAYVVGAGGSGGGGGTNGHDGGKGGAGIITIWEYYQ